MADLISREEIYKAVGELAETFRSGESGAYYAAWRIDEMIGNLPSVDAAEVVRCQYCAYFAEARVNEKGFLICPASGMEITGMDFCSYGERKEDNAR